MSSAYTDTYYSRTAAASETCPAATGRIQADVCIVGGGLAGLTAALKLARSGRKVVLLEARRVAWGASGRNGGFVSAGYATGLSSIERQVGKDQASRSFATPSPNSASRMPVSFPASRRPCATTRAAPCMLLARASSASSG
jgi:gamma-glutamylputrescine oxidase